MADPTKKNSIVEMNENEKPMAVGTVKEVTAASVALAAAVEAQKPSLFHRSMWPLWFVLSVSYFISTMNGYDSSLMVSHSIGYFFLPGLILQGFHKCHGDISEDLQSQRSRLLDRYHLHHLQPGTNCRFPVLRFVGGRIWT